MKLTTIAIALAALASPILANEVVKNAGMYTHGECTYDIEGEMGCCMF